MAEERWAAPGYRSRPIDAVLERLEADLGQVYGVAAFLLAQMARR